MLATFMKISPKIGSPLMTPQPLFVQPAGRVNVTGTSSAPAKNPVPVPGSTVTGVVSGKVGVSPAAGAVVDTVGSTVPAVVDLSEVSEHAAIGMAAMGAIATLRTEDAGRLVARLDRVGSTLMALLLVDTARRDASPDLRIV